MLERQLRLVSESLARSVDRRKFLKRAGTTIFTGMAALASGHLLAGRASADAPVSMDPVCAPPGPYCNLNGVNEPNGCHGGSCFQHLYQGQVVQCRIWECCYQAGCWSTVVKGGFWTCCDCECLQKGVRVATCGCAQFSTNPPPRPDRPSQ